MVIGLAFSGVVAGVLGAAWAAAAGMPLLLVLSVYPVAGICGSFLFLMFAFLRPGNDGNLRTTGPELGRG